MPINRNAFTSCKGFSLIELAIVLLIISILIGSFVGTLSQRIDNTRSSETKKELEVIKKAIIGFSYTQAVGAPYLPCPDCVGGACTGGTVADGGEDINGTACSVGNATGNIPHVTLGLGDGDAWGSRYRYWVDPAYASRLAGFTLATANGAGVIQEPNIAVDATGATPKSLATNVVAVIFSHGKNRFGGTSDLNNNAWPAVPAANLDEAENNDSDVTFVSRIATDTNATIATGEFDDSIIWISEYELKAHMIEAQLLP